MADNDSPEGPENATGGAGGGDSGGPVQPSAAGGSSSDSQNTVLSLAQLIGSPIHALVDAEAQSAMATARFIRTVGFEPPEDGDPRKLGDLQMAEFRRVRRGPNDEQLEDEIQIPLLTLVPIPMLQIRDAELEYHVKVIQTEALPPPHEEVAEKVPEEDAKNVPIEDRFLPERLATVRATFTSAPRPDARRSVDMLLKMKVRMEQADMPEGLSRLLNLAAESVGRKPKGTNGENEGGAPAKKDAGKRKK